MHDAETRNNHAETKNIAAESPHNHAETKKKHCRRAKQTAFWVKLSCGKAKQESKGRGITALVKQLAGKWAVMAALYGLRPS
jgi:hypothetical protein